MDAQKYDLFRLEKFCEKFGYVIAFPGNAVVKGKIDFLLDPARVVAALTGQKARLFDDVYYAAASWDRPRRLEIKAECLSKGPSPRFILTNLTQPAQVIYDQIYVQRRAESEHRN